MDVWTLGGYLFSVKYNQLPISLMPLTPRGSVPFLASLPPQYWKARGIKEEEGSS
jgi:hypothetical protein